MVKKGLCRHADRCPHIAIRDVKGSPQFNTTPTTHTHTHTVSGLFSYRGPMMDTTGRPYCRLEEEVQAATSQHCPPTYGARRAHTHRLASSPLPVLQRAPGRRRNCVPKKTRLPIEIESRAVDSSRRRRRGYDDNPSGIVVVRRRRR